MPMILLRIAGSFFAKYGMLLLRIGLITSVAFFAIKYFESAGANKEIIKTIEKETIIRERVIDAVRSAPRNVEPALEFLRERQRRN